LGKPREADIHGGRKLAERLIEVIHLRQNTNDDDNNEDVCRWVTELVISRKRKF